MTKLTQEDYDTLRYFAEEKGDVTRWVGWEDKRVLIEREHPELIKAVNDVNMAKRILAAVIKSLP